MVLLREGRQRYVPRFIKHTLIINAATVGTEQYPLQVQLLHGFYGQFQAEVQLVEFSFNVTIYENYACNGTQLASKIISLSAADAGSRFSYWLDISFEGFAHCVAIFSTDSNITLIMDSFTFGDTFKGRSMLLGNYLSRLKVVCSSTRASTTQTRPLL